MRNKIILGTVQFGVRYGINNLAGKPSQETVNSILDLAFRNNIRLLDSAEAYGNSQEVIGNYHRTSNNRFDVITKFHSVSDSLPVSLRNRISENLRVLNVDSLYCYMFHSFKDFLVHFNVYKEEINELKNAGIIGKFGVSVYTNEEIEGLLEFDGVDLIQFPFNLLDNNNKRAAMIKKAKSKGIEIHTRSTFLQGLFFKQVDELQGKLIPLRPYLGQVNSVAAASNLRVTDLALNYVTGQETIDKVLIGVDSPEQLEDNLRSLQHTISLQALEQINRLDVKETELLNPSNWIG